MLLTFQAVYREDLKGRSKREVEKMKININRNNKFCTRIRLSYRRNKRKFIRESSKIDENEMLNRDEKLKEEVIKLFLENFLALALHPNHYGKTDILELNIEQMKDQLDKWIQQGIIEPANSPWASPLVPVKKKDKRT